MLLQHATWKEVETYLEHARGIVIPIGSTEQHGPIGLIGTDALTAESIAHRLAQTTGVLVGPTIALGVAQFNLAFPGTVSLRASTLMALIEDYVRSLARQGFTHFYFLNGHGGNIAPARAAFQDIYSAWSLGDAGGTAVRCRLRSWWEYPAVDSLRRALYGAGEGLHATPSEVAITQHAQPGSARKTTLGAPERVSAAFLRDHGGDNHWDADSHRQAFPDGRVGSDSALATPEHGKQLIEAAVEGAAADYRAFIAEE
ncbi:MAG: creatininase family protein [Betaproteobacteria bacterium]|nr:creatininase family protein [Betaproteobacteria bacterium]